MSGNQKKGLDPAIHRVRLEKLTIFEITEGELDAIEQGSPDSVLLNVAIAAGSIGISFAVALATTEIKSVPTFCVFVIITVITFIASVVLLLLWWRSHRSTASVVSVIRGRVAPEGIQESVDAANTKTV